MSVVLYVPNLAPSGFNLSPFCYKLEIYLRLAQIPFETREANMLKAPKRKIPYVDVEGQLIGDSTLIIQHLQSTTQVDLDAELSAQQRMQSHLLRRMLEESTYFSLLYLRWRIEWQHYRPYFLKSLPPMLGGLLVPLIRRSAQKTLHAQGMGRHTQEEVMSMFNADLACLAQALESQEFAVHSKPSLADATVYAFLRGFLHIPWEGPSKQAALAFPVFESYLQRMDAHLNTLSTSAVATK
ncbi:MAG: glutathione S-transferase family protein [Myxococcota bacterium]